eukprot:TRINITY_DN8708_c0_g1_i2.p1 TRINITY_DN8708_c0_g1~~TRINITY_DN8708_c0_g1_i2.p1  ORF type:complete len:143 (+),score=8.45 TRINITY_DN8708_c0_g1_i2:181-609(+)
MPNRGPGAFTQDWDPVVIHKRPQKSSEIKDPKAVNEARRQGAAIESVKKYDAGSNKASSSNPGLYARKIAEETDVLAHERVSAELKTRIQKARLDAKLTQAQLAQKINEVSLSFKVVFTHLDGTRSLKSQEDPSITSSVILH